MKKTLRFLALLLVLTITMSYAVMGVSAEEWDLEESHDPYLSFVWLSWNEEGRMYPQENGTDENGNTWLETLCTFFAMTPYDQMWHQYYLNTWDDTAGDWVQEVINPNDLYSTGVVAVEVYDSITDGKPEAAENADTSKFCRIVANDWGEGQVCYDYEGTVLTVDVHVCLPEIGFYARNELSTEAYIQEAYVDPLEETDPIYLIFNKNYENNDGYWTVTEVQLNEGWESSDYVTLEQVSTDKCVWKVTLKDGVAERMFSHGGFDIEVVLTAEDPDSNENEWRRNIWFFLDMAAFNDGVNIGMDDAEYTFYSNGSHSAIVPTEEFDEWGNRIYQGIMGYDLPEGVSYDYETTTLTLNNANLETLNLWNQYEIWEDDNYKGTGYQFPEGLTIQLVGENTIVNETDTALNLSSELDATITGDGSLMVKAINSEDNTRTQWFWINEEEVTREVHYCFDAGRLNDNSALTIAGNADVTFEVAGSAINEWYDDSSDEFISEAAFLSALQGGQGSLTVKDNATLSTVLPEDAKRNGQVVYADDANQEEWWNYNTPGGYSGLDNFSSITVAGNATVNTTTLNINDCYDWDGEKEIFVKDSTLTVSGGTLNITALGSYEKIENWQWNEETQQDEYLGITDHSHYEGLYNRNGTITVSGGVLNINIDPTEEDLKSSVGGRGICLEGEGPVLNISGGEVNIASFGAGIELQGWYDEEAGKEYTSTANITGGEVNIMNGALALNITPYGTANISGGTVNANGTINLACEWDENGTVARAGSLNVSGGKLNQRNGWLNTNGGSITLTGGEVNLDNVEVNAYDYSILTIDGAAVTVNDATPREGDEWPVAIRVSRDCDLIVKGGSLVINTTGYECALEVSGDYTQTGGAVTIDADAAKNDEDSLITSGMSCGGLATISGGTLDITAEGWMGYEQWYDSGSEDGSWPANPNTKLTISGDAVVNISSTDRGMWLTAPAEFTGGSVNAVSTGFEGYWVDDVTGEKSDSFLWGDAIAVAPNGSEDVPASLTISGGNHTMTAPQNDNVNATNGIAAYAPVTISGGKCEIHADRALYIETDDEAANHVSLDKMFAYSMKDGHELNFVNISCSLHSVNSDMDYTIYVSWLEEDGEIDSDIEDAQSIYGPFSHESINPSSDVAIAATKCEAVDHSYTQNVTGPTCTEQGYTTYTCSECGDSYVGSYVDATGHSEVTIPGKAATCTEDGLTDGTGCVFCGTVFTEQETIPATGHSWSDWTVYTEASYEAPGEERKTCTNCGEYESRATEMLSGWAQKGSVWYYYQDGSAQTGWQQISGIWYYFSPNGAMQTGWQKINGNWYYFTSGGAMLTGWQQLGSTWYYFTPGGAMQTGWQKIGGTWYYFTPGGAMQTGWQQISGTWYYFAPGGAMQTGWQKIGSTWYYFTSGGAMQTGWQKIGNTWYYFTSGGAMQTGWQKIGSNWYYFTSGGAMVTGTYTINGTKYTFSSSGVWLG